VIDAITNVVTATIPLDSKPEFAVTDGAGRVYVNLEDRNSVAVIDARTATVEKVWPIGGCEQPTGLAIDHAHQRLFTVCSNKLMAVVDAATGRLVATLPIGGRVDGAAFDERTQLAFASAGDGTLTVIEEKTPDVFLVLQNVPTQAGARTLALDGETHYVYSVTANLGATPAATAAQPHPRPPIEPGSFVLLVITP
jgi:DNA-binding beta-propeller fold protein YncE